MRVATFLRTTVHIHVDAIWTTEPIPTGEQPGDWKLVGQYDDFWIRKQGNIGDGPFTLKHAGVPLRALSTDRLHPLTFADNKTRV